MPFMNPILAGEELIRSAMRSEGFVAGVSGWSVQRDGDAEFNDVTFRGTLEGTATYADEAGNAALADAVNGPVTSTDMNAQSPGYTPGSSDAPGAGWMVDSAGNAEFNELTARGDLEGPTAAFDTLAANNSFLYKGNELQVLLDNAPRGLLAFGQLAAGSYTVTGGSGIRPFLELDVIVGANRVFKIYTNPVRITSPVGTENPRFLLFYTTDGSSPVPFSGTTALAELSVHTNVVANRTISEFITWTAFLGNFTRLRVVLCVDAEFANTVNLPFDKIKLHVEDIGKFPLVSTAINRYAGTGTTKIYKEFAVEVASIRTYQGDGDYIRDDLSYQGTFPGSVNGNQSSMSWFNMSLINDMNGVLPADIVFLDYELIWPHWYNSSGGDAICGYHTQTAVPAVGVGQNFAACIGDVLRVNFPGRNITKRFSVMGTAIQTALLNGTWRGILLGQAPTTNQRYYGYASYLVVKAGYFK